MKVVHIIDSLGRGGAENLVIGLAVEMIRLGHEVSIITLTSRNDFVALTAQHQLAVYSCGFAGTIHSAVAVVNLMRRLRTLIATLKPDVINTHIFMSDLMTRIACGLRVPVVTTFHTNEDWWSRPAGLKKYLKRWVESVTARLLTQRFIAVSQAAANDAATYLGIDPRRCHVIRNGVDTQHFVPATKAMQQPPAIIQVARFYSEKKHETALRAFGAVLAAVPDAQLWLVGDGPVRPQIESLARTLDIAAHVRFLGLRDDVDQLLQQCQLFWLTSRREGLPISLLEAMAAGLVPVVTAVGDIPTVVEHGYNGFLAEVGDSNSMARVSSALLLDRDRHREMSSAARDTILRRHSIAETAENYLCVYSQVTGAD